jgi:hypothetical protein
VTKPGDDGIIEHDPLAEEADLLTLREARARVTEELHRIRRQLAALEGATSAGGDLAAARARLEHLERVLARLSAGPPA